MRRIAVATKTNKREFSRRTHPQLCDVGLALLDDGILRPAGTLGLCVWLLLGATSANATVLIFDKEDPNFANNEVVPQIYGDRVAATIDANEYKYKYEVGNGFTPNVVVDYNPDDAQQQFEIFEGGFGDLNRALGDFDSDVSGEILLTPDPGFFVHLNSFDVAAWNIGSSAGQIVVFDGLNSEDEVWSYSGDFAQDNSRDSFSFSPAVSSTTAIRIRSPNFGTLGIDNINFDQSVVPEPATIALWSLAGLLCTYLARRRRWV